MMHTTRFSHLVRGLTVVALLLLVVVPSVAAAPREWQAVYVDANGGCDGHSPCHTTIEAAMQAANSGDLVQIYAGHYPEMLNVSGGEEVELVGAVRAGDVYIAAGSLDLCSHTLTVDGDFYNLADTNSYTDQGGTLNFDTPGVHALNLEVVTFFENLTIGPDVVLVDASTGDHAFVQGKLENHGQILRQVEVPGPGEYYFGLAGRANGGDIVVNIINSTATAILLTQHGEDHPGRTGTSLNGAGWAPWWSFAADGLSMAALTFPITPREPAANIVELCNYLDTNRWECRRTSAGADYVKLADVEPMGDWSLSEATPTAVTLLDLHAAPARPGAAALAAFAGLAGLILLYFVGSRCRV